MTYIDYMKYLYSMGPLDKKIKALLVSAWDLGYAQGLKEGAALERENCAKLGLE